MISIVPFETKHIIYLDVDEYVLKQCREIGFDKVKELCKSYEDSGYSFTCLKDSIPVACAGIHNNWAWLVIDKTRFKGLTLFIIKSLMTGLETLQQELKQDIYAHADLDYPKNARLLQLLGFEPTNEDETFVRRFVWA